MTHVFPLLLSDPHTSENREQSTNVLRMFIVPSDGANAPEIKLDGLEDFFGCNCDCTHDFYTHGRLNMNN